MMKAIKLKANSKATRDRLEKIIFEIKLPDSDDIIEMDAFQLNKKLKKLKIHNFGNIVLDYLQLNNNTGIISKMMANVGDSEVDKQVVDFVNNLVDQINERVVIENNRTETAEMKGEIGDAVDGEYREVNADTNAEVVDTVDKSDVNEITKEMQEIINESITIYMREYSGNKSINYKEVIVNNMKSSMEVTEITPEEMQKLQGSGEVNVVNVDMGDNRQKNQNIIQNSITDTLKQLLVDKNTKQNSSEEAGGETVDTNESTYLIIDTWGLTNIFNAIKFETNNIMMESLSTAVFNIAPLGINWRFTLKNRDWKLIKKTAVFMCEMIIYAVLYRACILNGNVSESVYNAFQFINVLFEFMMCMKAGSLILRTLEIWVDNAAVKAGNRQ